MSGIRRLPDHLVNKIAAGEVVERPASVVKELVENAIDAESRTITVELKDAGRQLIRVSDDGTGMSAAEIDLALMRHATSKLPTDEDLDAIATLGFRGEALPAICAVTRFSLTSCPRGGDAGTLVRGEGGVVAEKLLVAATPGTTVEAQDLFFNTPARLKFLKTAPTELAAALRLIEGIALAHPGIHFRVTHNGKPSLTAPAAGTLRDRLGALRGFDLARRMLDVGCREEGVVIQGLAAPPQLARGNRDAITLIVNGRPVRDTLLTQSLIDAYRPLLARDRFPAAVLRIELPSREVDVNVHPTKAWVRFRAPRLVQEALYAAVQNALRSARVVQPQPGLTTPTRTEAWRGSAGAQKWPPQIEDGQAPNLATNPGTAISGPPQIEDGQTHDLATNPGTATSGPPQMEDGRPGHLTPDSWHGEPGQAMLFQERGAAFGTPRFGSVIGQLQETFVVSANEEEVFFVDQHVAHERVLFERLEREIERTPLASQELLFPQPLDLPSGQAALLREWAPTLDGLGFALEGFGGSTVLLRAVPALLRGEEPRRLIEGLLDEVGGHHRAETAPLLHRALAFVACRAAIKAHEHLEPGEMTRLLGDLSETRTPYFCPHGRPIVSRLSLREIKRELGRTW